MTVEPTPTLEEAWTAHHVYVEKLAMKFAKNRDDAEDWTQDVFLHLQTRLHLFKGECKFRTWLHRVAVNKFLMRIRESKARGGPVASLDEWAEDDEGSDSNSDIARLAKALTFVDPNLRSALDRVALERVVKNMPPSYKLALELHLQGFDHQEVSEMLGWHVGSSKSLLCRARAWTAGALGVEYAERAKEDDVDELFKGLGEFLEDEGDAA
jgi:RNA polymerase sigma-70 factor (ECF subfamily)